MLAKPEHEIAFQDLNALLKKHADEHGLSSLEMLAIASNLVGKLVALQDQRTVTPAVAMKVVTMNLEEGNRQAIEAVMQSQGQA